MGGFIKQEENKTFRDERVQKILKQEKTWSGMWLTFGQTRYNYDKKFTAVSNYVKNNNINED